MTPLLHASVAAPRHSKHDTTQPCGSVLRLVEGREKIRRVFEALSLYITNQYATCQENWHLGSAMVSPTTKALDDSDISPKEK